MVDHHDSYTWNLVHLVGSVTGVLPRALFHARVRALEDLAYGVDEDSPPYRDNALRAIRRLF